MKEFSGKDALDDVNKYIAKGWVLVNTHSAGTEEAMDFYYILGANQHVYNEYINSGNSKKLEDYIKLINV